jgi:hypothetical protein
MAASIAAIKKGKAVEITNGLLKIEVWILDDYLVTVEISL